MKNKNKAQVAVLNETSFPIEVTESILEASLRNDVPFCCDCGGMGRCSTCRILIVEGEENLSPINTAETKLREFFQLPANVRLACQTYVEKGNVSIQRIMNDDSDYPIYLRNKIVKDEVVGKELRLCLLFLDIRNFTPFVEHSLAFDVIHIIRKLFFAFEKIIEKHGGKIIETVGDGLYAAFGFKETTKASANVTVACGYELLEALDELNANYFSKFFNRNIEIGIGVHLGKVATGTLLLKNMPHELVMGYPVNVASRIQDITKKLNNNFIVTNQVYSLLENPPESTTKQTTLKGIEELFELHLIGNSFGYKREENEQRIR